MFNDTSRYLDDIFTIDNPEFEKHILDIYQTELQFNKANTSDLMPVFGTAQSLHTHLRQVDRIA